MGGWKVISGLRIRFYNKVDPWQQGLMRGLLWKVGHLTALGNCSNTRENVFGLRIKDFSTGCFESGFQGIWNNWRVGRNVPCFRHPGH